MNWRDNVRKVKPYVPGEQPHIAGMIKLNTNENPYPPSPEVEKALEKLDATAFRLYPDTNAEPLTDELAKYYGFKKENVFVGVGSDDVLAMSFLTFFNSDKDILFPDITYSFYDVWAKIFGIRFRRPGLNERYEVTADDYLVPNGGIIIANPNAPTAIAMPAGEIERIIAGNPGSVVIIDEAYVDFGGESVLPLVGRYDNLLVVRTFSKSRSMAGARIGFAIGNAELIAALNAVKNSYNSYTMNLASIVLGTAAVKDDAYFKQTIEKIVNTRESFAGEIEAMGFDVLPSSANFVFVKHENISAKVLFEELKKKNIFVRYFDKPGISDRLRITIGTDDEMKKLLEELSGLVC